MDANVLSVEGHLVALSHTFKICSDVLFLMEILSGEEVNHILVRREKQLPWHQQLDMRSKYRITHLKPDILYKGRNNIPIFHTTRKSNLIYVETDEVPGALNLSNDKSLISYQGTVTGILDEDIGIYQLDGRTRLVVAYIHDVTGEIWNMLDDPKIVDFASDKMCRTKRYKCLQVGDKLMIFHAHFARIDGAPHLLCCGRSLIMKTRQSLVKATGLRSQNATLDALHYYNFGMHGVTWLAEVRDHLLHVLCPSIMKETDILRRRQNGAQSLLTQLLKFAVDRQLLATSSRSLTLEFLAPNHQCVLMREFQAPFTLVSVGDLASSFSSEEFEAEEKQKLWTYSISHPDQSRVIVGLLHLGQNGVLKLQDQHAEKDLVIVGNKEDLLEKIGALVVVFDAQYIEETFNIIEDGSIDNYAKKYLMVRNFDIIVLRKYNVGEQMDTGLDTFYTMKIISKSNIICSQHQNKKQLKNVDMFFMVQAVIQKVNEKDLQEDRWKTFVKFQGRSALYHPCIEDGISYKVRIPEMSAYDMKIRKQYSNSWLQPLKPYFGTCECTYLPEESVFEAAVQGRKHLNEISVCRILQGSFNECGPFSVIAVVKDRQHMTPKFPSEFKSNSVEFSSQHHIGIPGNKIIRVLLCDCENPDEEIWLYFSSTSNYHIPHYALGIVPGVTIIVSCVLRNVSKQNKKIYLQSTVFTCLTPLSKAAQDMSLYLPSLHKPKLRYLGDIVGHQGTSFQTFATIGRICKVSLNCVCSFCSSEMVGGFCTYVGCHAQGTAKMVASAQIVIDDGTGTAMLYISSVEHVKVLLRLTPIQYSLLSQQITSGSYNLCYTSRFKDGDSIDSSQHLQSGLTKAMEALCCNSQLLRPVNLVCRMFKNQQRREEQDGGRMHLYCLGFSEIKPNVDFKDLLKDVI